MPRSNQPRIDRESKKIAFSERLSFLIKRLDLSDAELSRRSGLPKNTISRYRNAESLPEAHHLFIVARALDVDPEWLITGNGKPIRAEGSSADENQKNFVDLFNALDPEAQKFLMDAAAFLWSRPSAADPSPGQPNLLHDGISPGFKSQEGSFD